MMIVNTFYLVILSIQISIISTSFIDSTSDLLTTTSKANIENPIQKNRKYKLSRVILNSNRIKQLSSGESIQIECPSPHSTQNSLNKDTKNNKLKSTPVYITNWFKNQLKMHQFGESNERVTFIGRKLKINNLVKSDTAIYSCEIIMGTGQIVHSANLSLQIDKSDMNKNDLIEPDQISEDYQIKDVEQFEITNYDGLSYMGQKNNYLNINNDFSKNKNIAYELLNLPNLKDQPKNEMDLEIEKKIKKENQFLSTPIVVIIAVAIISILLILFLCCFYKNI